MDMNYVDSECKSVLTFMDQLKDENSLEIIRYKGGKIQTFLFDKQQSEHTRKKNVEAVIFRSGFETFKWDKDGETDEIPNELEWQMTMSQP